MGTGLTEETDKTRPSADVDLSAYSAAQLAALEPAKLSDDELVVAYRTAVQVDAPAVANQFADHLVRRDSAASKIDMIVVFRRLITETLQGRLKGDLPDLIARGRAFDQRQYEGREQATFDFLEARSKVSSGQKEEGLAGLKQLPTSHPDRLDVVASAVETLLSLGAYGDAKEMAEIGLARRSRNGTRICRLASRITCKRRRLERRSDGSESCPNLPSDRA